MTFEECCSECLNNKYLVDEFNRLTNSGIGLKRNDIIMAIDKACGYDPNKEDMPKFVAFVYNFIWIPMVCKEIR